MPVCRVERIAADLTNDSERKILFDRLSPQYSQALIITEGVIVYMTNDQAGKLSEDLFDAPSCSKKILKHYTFPS